MTGPTVTWYRIDDSGHAHRVSAWDPTTGFELACGVRARHLAGTGTEQPATVCYDCATTDRVSA